MFVREYRQVEAAQQVQAQRQYQQQFAEYAKAEDSKADKLLSGVEAKS